MATSARLTRLILVMLSLLSTHRGLADSTCYGTTAKGRLENGVRLPSQGTNFVSYGTVPELAGRTYVHHKVRDVMVDAYLALERDQSDKVFKYAETGFKAGGRFSPHKTHQNGLSVDFMVPVVDRAGRSVHLPTHAFNKYGYDIEFDPHGRYDEYTIDYEALAAHLVALHRAARKHEVGIWRVIFDPALSPKLYQTKYGPYLKQHISIPKTQSWVRHDEHYHVDFQVDCRP